jgi:hypothetical protein
MLRVVRLDVLGRGGRAVGHDEDAGRHATPALPSSCTSFTIASSTRGSVVGQYAVAEVEDVTGVAHRRGCSTSRASSRTPSSTPERHRGRVEVALQGVAGPDPPPGLVEGNASSRCPTTSAPAEAMRGSR